MTLVEDRTIRLDREALAEALAPGGEVVPAEVVLDVGRQVVRAPGEAPREFSGAGLAVLILQYLKRSKVPVPKDASKRVLVGADEVALVLHLRHPSKAPAGPTGAGPPGA